MITICNQNHTLVQNNVETLKIKMRWKIVDA